jgi:hypothetical protein
MSLKLNNSFRFVALSSYPSLVELHGACWARKTICLIAQLAELIGHEDNRLITQHQVLRGALTATQTVSKRGCHPLLGQNA